MRFMLGHRLEDPICTKTFFATFAFPLNSEMKATTESVLEAIGEPGGNPVNRPVEINETPPDPEGPEAESLCSWWRRGRV